MRGRDEEHHQEHRALGKAKLNELIHLEEPKAKMLRSAAVLAQDLGKSGIVVFTRSGFSPTRSPRCAPTAFRFTRSRMTKRFSGN